MAKVDSKGRIVLPQKVRDRLGVTPGTEVEVRAEGGKAVVEPEDDPDRIIERMEALVGEISDRDPTPFEDLDPQAQDHVDTIRRQAKEPEAEDS